VGGRYSTTPPPLMTNLPLPTQPHMILSHLKHRLGGPQVPGGWREPAVPRSTRKEPTRLSIAIIPLPHGLPDQNRVLTAPGDVGKDLWPLGTLWGRGEP